MLYIDTSYTWKVTQNLVYNTTSPSLMLDIYEPDKYAYFGNGWTPQTPVPVGLARPCIVWQHGGSFISGSKAEGGIYAKEFAKRGWVSAALDYRKPVPYIFPINENMAIADMKAAIRYLRANAATYNIDPNKIIACGDSAGGFGAIQSAISDYVETNGNNGQSSTPNAVVALWAPVTSKPGFSITNAQQIANIAAGKLDIFAGVQGGMDTQVPPAEMRALYNYIVGARGTGKALYIELPDAGHNQPWRMPRVVFNGNEYTPVTATQGFFEDAMLTIIGYLVTKLSLLI